MLVLVPVRDSVQVSELELARGLAPVLGPATAVAEALEQAREPELVLVPEQALVLGLEQEPELVKVQEQGPGLESVKEQE